MAHISNQAWPLWMYEIGEQHKGRVWRSHSVVLQIEFKPNESLTTFTCESSCWIPLALERCKNRQECIFFYSWNYIKCAFIIKKRNCQLIHLRKYIFGGQFKITKPTAWKRFQQVGSHCRDGPLGVKMREFLHLGSGVGAVRARKGLSFWDNPFRELFSFLFSLEVKWLQPSPGKGLNE